MMTVRILACERAFVCAVDALTHVLFASFENVGQTYAKGCHDDGGTYA